MLVTGFFLDSEILPKWLVPLLVLMPDATICQIAEGIHMGCGGYHVLFTCFLQAPLLFEGKALFKTTMRTAAVQDIQSSYVCLSRYKYYAGRISAAEYCLLNHFGLSY